MTRLTEIPEVYFVNPAELGEEQRINLGKWKQDFSEQTALWLPTQRDTDFNAEDHVIAEWWTTPFGPCHAAWLEGRKGQEESE